MGDPAIPRAPSVRTIIDASFRADPYPTYRALREAAPLHWSEEFFGGAWLLTRHAEVQQVLRDPVRFAAQRTAGWMRQAFLESDESGRFQQLFARALLFLDGSDHARIRSVLDAGFRKGALERFAPAIERRADELLDAIDPTQPFDFMGAFARPLPADVMAMLMGMDASDRRDFSAWSDDLAAFIGAAAPSQEEARRARTSLLAMCACFEAIVRQRRREPGDDLVSRLLQGEAQGAIASGPELLVQCAMLLFAGLETTRNLLGNGLHTLLAHPEQWQHLKQQPQAWPNAIRELLRFESPVQYTARRVTGDLVLHGRRLRRGDLVIALIGSANRDAERHADPDRFDIARPPGPQLSFGAGPHVCLGAALTLMEAEIGFRRLAHRFPRLRTVADAPRWNGNLVYRGLDSLYVLQAPETRANA